MEIKVIVKKKPEDCEGECPSPRYATVEIKGDSTIVKDLFDKIRGFYSEDYTFE